MIKWFKTKKEAQIFNDSQWCKESVFKDKRAKHKRKPFAVTNYMMWINRG